MTGDVLYRLNRRMSQSLGHIIPSVCLLLIQYPVLDILPALKGEDLRLFPRNAMPQRMEVTGDNEQSKSDISIDNL